MTKISETIVFFGSGPVGAKSLGLLAKDFPIEAVVTKPKPDHHKGEFPVIAIAEALSLPVYTVSNKQDLSELIKTRPFKSRLGVLIDFGIIVTNDVIDYFPLGIINSHFSLLPEWRGADPISFAILSGQAKTGVSLMLIDEGMDTGKLLTQKVRPISPTATTPSLTDELITLSNQLLRDFVPGYIAGKVKPKNQPHPDRATYSRKLTKEDGIIDWNKPAKQIEQEIRAFIEWPKSRTTILNKELIITTVHILDKNGPIGTVEIINKQPVVYCGKQALVLDGVKPVGKTEMTGQAFLVGLR